MLTCILVIIKVVICLGILAWIVTEDDRERKQQAARVKQYKA